QRLDLSFDQLCALLSCDSCDALVRREPYRPSSAKSLHLVAPAVKECLTRLQASLSGPDAVAVAAAAAPPEHARGVSACTMAILEHWRGGNDGGDSGGRGSGNGGGSIIPKGAVMDELVQSSFESRATCYDEFNQRLTITGFRAAMTHGANV